MATALRIPALPLSAYPTGDGQPMAETEIHLEVLIEARELVQSWYAAQPRVYVGSNMLVYYEEGNPQRHLAPDLFVAEGVAKLPPRDCFFIWIEGKAPAWALEVTSKTTRREDQDEKLRVYRDEWKVKEYFLFDPRAEWLEPPLQGYRRRGSRYVRIRPVHGRLPSQVLGLHLEGEGRRLRFWDPATGQYLKTVREQNAELEAACQQAEAELQREAQARQQAEAEVERLRRELEALRRRRP